MEPTVSHLEELSRASLNAERALNAAFATEFAQYPEIQRKTWAAAAILHCDVLRYMVTLENATSDGIARLLWIGDVVSVLYEAKLGFEQSGNSALFEIAKEKSFDTDIVRSELRDMIKCHPLIGIESFSNYRNKVGHHYDRDFVTHLHEFSLTDARPFFEVLTNYAKYTNKWVVLCKRIIEHNASPKV